MGVEATTGFKGDRISQRKLANARRCIICYTELDTIGHKEISMKVLVDASKDLFGVRIRSGLAKAGFFRMCEECFSEFTDLDVKRQERPGKLDENTKEECAKYASKIVDSIKSSQYVSNNVFGDPFDSFRFSIFKDWRKACIDGFEAEDGSFRLPDSCPLLKMDLPPLPVNKPATLRRSQPANPVEPVVTQIKQEFPEPPAAPVQIKPLSVNKNTRVIFVKRDPATGETVEVTQPTNTNGVIRGKMNGKSVIIMSKEPAAKGLQQQQVRVRSLQRTVDDQRNRGQMNQSSDFYIDASNFVSTELKVADDEPESAAADDDQKDYMPNLEGVDISFADPADRSNSPPEGIDQLKYGKEDQSSSTSSPAPVVVPKKKSSPKGVTISPDVSKVSMEVVRSQRSGRVINKRTYDADWVTGSAVNQIFQGMKPMKVTSPANKKAKVDNQQAS